MAESNRFAWVPTPGPSHLLATVPQFGLRVFQEPSGMDLRGTRGDANGAPNPRGDYLAPPFACNTAETPPIL